MISKRGTFRAPQRRGMSLVRSIVAAGASLALMTIGLNLAVRWVTQKAIESSGKPIPGLDTQPAFKIQTYDFNHDQPISQVGIYSPAN